MQQLFDKLGENMQVIYRKAIDADQALAQIQQGGQGKFQNIFKADAGFAVASKRFMPYVEELGAEIAALSEQDPQVLEQLLPGIVRKMELLLTTLSQFKDTLRKE